ncbi:DUF4296 domain-containing protein [Mucilaginibacter sp. HMF5004]|uniref:DUF4296 domain-containing protein n=1 Tax=Mucilaginibacter rivuli TaxID=2857527 RepID=UPI001C5ED718|nr:DUF4296 domain-containing protein [Mucilaginibacter rivuli]MBW4890770.1 DUF4296 domain-containing protein [Mucilaginibacter rivuli]
MRFYLILFFCGLGFLFSCSDDKSIPDDVIPKHQMALLLTDIHLVDGTISSLPNIPDTLAKHSLGLYLAVFKMHHTDTTQFRESLKYYATRPDLMNDIYTGVTRRLDSLLKAKTKVVKEVKPQASQKTTAQIADSVKKAQVKADSVKKVKADSVKLIQAKKRIDSVKASKLRMKVIMDVNKKAKIRRDSIRKAKHNKNPVKIITPDAVPN